MRRRRLGPFVIRSSGPFRTGFSSEIRAHHKLIITSVQKRGSDLDVGLVPGLIIRIGQFRLWKQVALLSRSGWFASEDYNYCSVPGMRCSLKGNIEYWYWSPLKLKLLNYYYFINTFIIYLLININFGFGSTKNQTNWHLTSSIFVIPF